MPLSTVDPTPALVVVDLQKGLLGATTAHPLGAVLGNAAALAKAFRAQGHPVVLVTVGGTAPGRIQAPSHRLAGGALPPGWADVADELDAQPADHRVTKTTWGAFHGTDLDAYLRERGVTQVFLAGVATSVGVESTARAAHEHGYHAVLAIDAMTDTNADAHDNSVTRIFPKLGETATTAEILSTAGAAAR